MITKHSFDSNEDLMAYKQVDAEDKRLLIKLVSLGGFFSCIIYSLLQMFPVATFEAYSSLIAAFVLFAMYLSQVYTTNYKIPAYIISLLVSVCYVFYIFDKGIGGYDTFWFLIVPTVTISMLGLFYGVLLSAILFITAIMVSSCSPTILKSGITEGIFFFSYILIMVIITAYEWLRVNSRRQEVIAKNKQAKEEIASKDKTELLYELSHQIRTPLNSIMGITNLMKNEELTLDQQEYIDAINTSMMNLSLAMSSILTISNIETDNSYLQQNLYFDIADIMHHIDETYKAKKNCKVSLDISNFIPSKLTGDAKKIEQILEDIFDTILLHSRKSETIIDVFVNNKKETPAAVELLFEIHTTSIKNDFSKPNLPNQDSSIANEPVNFSNLVDLLDLSVAKQTVNAFGGNLAHKKKDAIIDVFEFNLILWKSQIPDTHSETVPISIHTKAKELSEASVLIVEDNLMNQKVLSLTLEPMVKSIEIANNGKEALKLFESSKFDIILMDIQMPILDGYKTTAKIRVSEIGTNFHVPIIALTANVMNGEMEKCFAYGMDDYLSKPFQIDILIEKIQYYLRKENNNKNGEL